MKRLLVITSLLFVCAATAMAQKGIAEPDYYPSGYSGDTWTGEVTASSEDTREFTLTYKRGDKEQTFIGVLPKGYTVKTKDGKDYEVKMNDLMGMRVKAYYMTKSTKDANGAKAKINEVFKIKFLPK
jgi:hypothetical protein